MSGKQQKKLVEQIIERCREAITAELLPKLHARFEGVLGPGDTATPWSLSPEEKDPQTIYFAYPASLGAEPRMPRTLTFAGWFSSSLGHGPTIGRRESKRLDPTPPRRCRRCSRNLSAGFAR